MWKALVLAPSLAPLYEYFRYALSGHAIFFKELLGKECKIIPTRRPPAALLLGSGRFHPNYQMLAAFLHPDLVSTRSSTYNRKQ